MFIFGILIQMVFLRPMIGEPIISVIMVTIALSTVLQAAMKWIFGVNPQPFPPIFTSQSMHFLGLQIQTVYVMSLVVSLAMMAAMAWFFQASKHGLAMRATAFDQQVAQSLGISVKNVFAMSWAISATVSAVAGVVVAVVNGVSSGLSIYGIKVFPAVILGGLDSIAGAVLGGVIIGLLENFAQFIDGPSEIGGRLRRAIRRQAVGHGSLGLSMLVANAMPVSVWLRCMALNCSP